MRPKSTRCNKRAGEEWAAVILWTNNQGWRLGWWSDGEVKKRAQADKRGRNKLYIKWYMKHTSATQTITKSPHTYCFKRTHMQIPVKWTKLQKQNKKERKKGKSIGMTAIFCQWNRRKRARARVHWLYSSQLSCDDKKKFNNRDICWPKSRTTMFDLCVVIQKSIGERNEGVWGNQYYNTTLYCTIVSLNINPKNYQKVVQC